MDFSPFLPEANSIMREPTGKVIRGRKMREEFEYHKEDASGSGMSCQHHDPFRQTDSWLSICYFTYAMEWTFSCRWACLHFPAAEMGDGLNRA
jgi:hypothetical protein